MDNRSDQDRAAIRGIGLYTIIAGLAMLGVLTVTVVVSLGGGSAQSRAAVSLLDQVAGATRRFNMDTSCYPKDLSGLISREAAVARNTCLGHLSKHQWQGPYIARSGRITKNHAMHTPSVGEDTTIAVVPASVEHTAPFDEGYVAVLEPVGRDLAGRIMAECGGKQRNGPCRIQSMQRSDAIVRILFQL